MPVARRTTVVWGMLLAAMTVTSITLSVLQPAPVPIDGPMGLRVVYREPTPAERILFETRVRLSPERWQRLAICYSEQAEGSAATLGQQHVAQGGDGLAYHFVINNGRGGPDGQIEMGARWRDQQPADPAALPEAALDDGQTLWICLIGRSDQAPTDAQRKQLRWLASRLTQRLHLQGEATQVAADVAMPLRELLSADDADAAARNG